MIVRFSPDARAELEAIGDYIARDTPHRAESYVAELRDKCEGLASMPLGFPLVPSYRASGIRLRVHGNYQIFYRVIGEPVEFIDILHIIHGTRDYGAMLF